MKKIELTKGQVALVDDDDYERLTQWKWCAQWNKDTRSFYAVRAQWNKKRKQCDYVSMAREIMHAQPGQQVDHISHDTLDNQKVNLRLCTQGENKRNQKRHKKHSSRHKGVCWNKEARKWVAQIGYKGHRLHLGYFTDEDDAGHAYDRAAIKYFGEFAHLNFPEEGGA